MKLSCCSLRRISRTRKLVLTIKPAISTANKITPKNSMTPSRQFRMIQPTLSATASATRPTPSTMKKAIVLRRLEICMQPFARDDCISQLECNGENDPSLADRTRRCPPVERGASLPVDTTPNRKRPSDRNTIGKRSREATPTLTPHVSAGNIAGKKPSPLQGATPDGRGRPSLQKQKGRPKAALKNHSTNP